MAVEADSQGMEQDSRNIEQATNQDEEPSSLFVEADKTQLLSRRDVTQSREDDSSALTKELIQAESRHFDVGAITVLHVSARGLTNIGTDIAMCHSVVEVDLSDNKLEYIDGLDKLKSLKKVVLSNNKLTNLGCLPRCHSLEHILLQGNLFRDDPALLAEGMALLPKLRSLYFQNFDGSDANDCCARQNYREKILSELPELCILDGERLRSADTAASMNVIRSLGLYNASGEIGKAGGDSNNTLQASLFDTNSDPTSYLRAALSQGSLTIPEMSFDEVDCDIMPSGESEQRLASLIGECREEQDKLSLLIQEMRISNKNKAKN